MNRDRVLGQRSTKNKMSYFPEDLLNQVLLKLPVKSLLRFKSVSQSWFSLISDPHFAKSHFELAARRTRKLLIFRFNLLPETRSIDAMLQDDSASSVIMSSNSPFHPNVVRVMGCCRGFLLILYGHLDLYLWNPSNGFHKSLSLSPTAMMGGVAFHYGFGYDPSTDDYLVALASYGSKPSSKPSTHFEIFSFRSNSWKEIDGSYLPYKAGLHYDPRSQSGCLLHGALHWLAYRHRQIVIVAFDLTKRSFSEILLPVDLDFNFNLVGLCVLERFLGLRVSLLVETDIWVMKEYKVQSSWTRSIHDIIIPSFSPICSNISGDIICGTDEWSLMLVKCNISGEELEHRVYPSPVTACALYTESLFSLPGDGRQDQDH